MSEAPAFDDSLGRVIVDHHTINLRQEHIAVASSRARAPGLARDLRRLGHSIFA